MRYLCNDSSGIKPGCLETRTLKRFIPRPDLGFIQDCAYCQNPSYPYPFRGCGSAVIGEIARVGFALWLSSSVRQNLCTEP